MHSNGLPEGFVFACALSDLSPKEGKRFIIDEEDIALFLVNGIVRALSNICPHQHSAIICNGFLEGEYVACPAHGWQFSLQTGRQPDGRKSLDVSEVLVQEGNVYVKPFKKKFNW